ncbi:MAG: VOC family protein [Pseudomonadota bacterium]
MVQGLIDLDHTIFMVRDLPDARDTWRRLGFTTTSYRPNPFYGGGETGGRGGNHLVVLTEQSAGTTNMIELAWADPDYAHPAALEASNKDPGLARLMLASDNVADLRDSWAKLGLAMSPNISHEGTYVDSETGQVDPVKYCGFIVEDNSWDYNLGAAQVMDFTQFTRPDLQNHQNGARYWKNVTLRVSSDDIAQSADFMSKLCGSKVQMLSDNAAEVTAHNISVRLVTAKGFQELFPASTNSDAMLPAEVNTGMDIVVASLPKAQDVLTENGVSVLNEGEAIHIAPRDATGIAIKFIEDAAI